MVGVTHITGLTIHHITVVTMVVIILHIMVATILHITGMMYIILIPLMGIEDLLQQTGGFPGILIRLNQMFITPEPVVQAGEQVLIALLQIQEPEIDQL